MSDEFSALIYHPPVRDLFTRVMGNSIFPEQPKYRIGNPYRLWLLGQRA
jgi:hypothetical protein